MARYALLLRGINLGSTNKVPMAELRSALEGLGYPAVTTHLNSGNAVLTGPDDVALGEQAARIEAAVAERTGVAAPCLLLTAEHLRAVVDGHPYAQEMAAVEKGGSRMMAHFLLAAPDPALLAEHDPAVFDPGNAQLGDRVIYQWCPDGLLQSPEVHGWATKHLGVEVTTRNWNTVAKLAALL
ncbi:MAG: DUF1697 domain-containing protein, partial [Pseudonocardia sp.]|nr:DUF1697 domain-containing protein [Pseudonocardia sp.]